MAFPRSRWRLLVRWFVGAVATLALLYLGGVNLLLRTRAIRSLINRDPNVVLVDYASAYTIVPGRIHVEGLHIRGNDDSVRWFLTVDRADFHLWVLDLLRRRFHAGHIRADGVTFRIVLKLRDDQVTEGFVAALPPIPGFTDVPMRLIGPPIAPPTDADYNLFSVQLDDVVADHVREVWPQTVRFAGDMRVTGRWLFRPTRWLDVGPATIATTGLDISYGPDRPLATGLRGQIDATVHPFDLRGPQGLAILGQLSTRTSLDGTAHFTAALKTFFELPGVSLLGSDGPVEARVLVDHGKVQVGSRIKLALPEASVAVKGATFPYTGTIRLSVAEGDRVPVTHVRLDASSVHALVHAREVAHAATAAAEITLPGLDIAQPSLEGATLSLDAPGVTAPDLRELNDFIPATSFVRIEQGLGKLDAHAEVDLTARRFRGEAKVTAEHLSFRVGPKPFRGELVVTVPARSTEANPGVIDLSGSTVAFSGAQGTHADAWWARGALSKASLQVAGGPEFRGDIQVEAKDSSPADALVADLTGTPSWLIGIAAAKNVTARAELRAGPSSFQVRSLTARGGSTWVRLEYAKRNEDKKGAARVNLGDFALGFNLGGEGPGFVLFDVDSWFASKVRSIDADPQLARSGG